ncbi:dCTP deaminase [Buchnera aphidicola (Eriosoma lanigerum)]|uniref:dCTP deaminase n=1 Tax=Buchnera aphidicola TaxID=9 RepID=UPI003463C25C
MRLSDKDIEFWLDSGLLKIFPRPESHLINGATVDIRLGNRFRVFRSNENKIINLGNDEQNIKDILEKTMSPEIFLSKTDYFFLKPSGFALAVTEEKISMPNTLVGWLDGRSSLGRLGLMVHATAHRIDPGWEGKIVLELFNSGKAVLVLQPGMYIGAISFEILSSMSIRPYNVRLGTKYLQQDSIIV